MVRRFNDVVGKGVAEGPANRGRSLRRERGGDDEVGLVSAKGTVVAGSHGVRQRHGVASRSI